MRRILFPLLIIGMVAGIFSIGSGAFFSDTETSTGNTFTAGSLNLQVGATDPTTFSFQVADVNPDTSGTQSVVLQNTGSVAGFLDISVASLVDLDNACPEPEDDVEGGVGCSATGELDSNLTLTICLSTGDTDCVDGGDTVVFATALASTLTATQVLDDAALAAGASRNLVIIWSVADSVGNVIQTDSFGFDFTVELDQNAD